jgi:hypothetical protein
MRRASMWQVNKCWVLCYRARNKKLNSQQTRVLNYNIRPPWSGLGQGFSWRIISRFAGLSMFLGVSSVQTRMSVLWFVEHVQVGTQRSGLDLWLALPCIGIQPTGVAILGQCRSCGEVHSLGPRALEPCPSRMLLYSLYLWDKDYYTFLIKQCSIWKCVHEVSSYCKGTFTSCHTAAAACVNPGMMPEQPGPSVPTVLSEFSCRSSVMSMGPVSRRSQTQEVRLLKGILV